METYLSILVAISLLKLSVLIFIACKTEVINEMTHLIYNKIGCEKNERSNFGGLSTTKKRPMTKKETYTALISEPGAVISVGG